VVRVHLVNHSPNDVWHVLDSRYTYNPQSAVTLYSSIGFPSAAHAECDLDTVYDDSSS
jgi:hypothetical protein